MLKSTRKIVELLQRIMNMTADETTAMAHLAQAVDRVGAKVQDLMSQVTAQAVNMTAMQAQIDALTKAATPDPAVAAAIEADAAKLDAIVPPDPVTASTP